MCISFCYRQEWLYLNHQDCQADDCQWAEESYKLCHTCIHRRAERCYLTNSLHPGDGCCHHNMEISLRSWQPVTGTMMTLWRAVTEDIYVAVLIAEGVQAVKSGSEGGALPEVNLDMLALPYLYGQGTEPITGDDLDWSGWFTMEEEGMEEEGMTDG